MWAVRIGVTANYQGRTVTRSTAELTDDDRVYARAYGLHVLERPVDLPEIGASRRLDFAASVPGEFPIDRPHHALGGFHQSVDVRYDPASGPRGSGRSIMWMRCKVPILEGEEPSPFQKLCPLADSANGISFHGSVRATLFLNADLTVAMHRPPVGDWLAADAESLWSPDGIGRADAALFDHEGAVGRSMQNLVLGSPPAAAAGDAI